MRLRETTDREFMLKAVALDLDLFMLAAPSLRADREFMLAAGRHNGWAMRWDR